MTAQRRKTSDLKDTLESLGIELSLRIAKKGTLTMNCLNSLSPYVRIP